MAGSPGGKPYLASLPHCTSSYDGKRPVVAVTLRVFSEFRRVSVSVQAMMRHFSSANIQVFPVRETSSLTLGI